VSDQQRAAAGIDVGLVERQRLRYPQPAAPQDGDQRADAQAVAVLAGLAHDQDDLLRPGWIGRILHTPCCAALARSDSRATSLANAVVRPHRREPSGLTWPAAFMAGGS
jgi:hypothetical protein